MKIFIAPQLLSGLINFFTNVVVGLLMLRTVLKFLGASLAAPFVSWIYETTQPLLYPFTNMFPTQKLSGGLMIELSTLFAILAYSFVGYLAIELIEILIYQSRLRDKQSSK